MITLRVASELMAHTKSRNLYHSFQLFYVGMVNMALGEELCGDISHDVCRCKIDGYQDVIYVLQLKINAMDFVILNTPGLTSVRYRNGFIMGLTWHEGEIRLHWPDPF
jgi:hypothetical protein